MSILGLYLGGLLLLMFEFFLVPGFGLPGLLGCCAIAGNVFLVFQTYGASVAWTVLGVQATVGLAAATAAVKVLPHTALGQAMTHKSKLSARAPAPPQLDADLFVGREGVAVGALAPQGTVRVDDADLPARARGGLIPTKSPVKVVAVDGRTLVVEAASA